MDGIFGACCIGRLFLRYFLLYWAVFSTSNIFIIFTGKTLNLFYAAIHCSKSAKYPAFSRAVGEDNFALNISVYCKLMQR